MKSLNESICVQARLLSPAGDIFVSLLLFGFYLFAAPYTRRDGKVTKLIKHLKNKYDLTDLGDLVGLAVVRVMSAKQFPCVRVVQLHAV